MRQPPGTLVTGATGFVGRALVNRLVFHEQRSVRVLLPENQTLPPAWAGHVEAWQGDLVIPESLEGIMRGIERVYHLAGEIRNPRLFDEVNRRGTENLLVSCRKEQVSRFLYFSSVGVFGADGRRRIVDENTVPNPRNDYEKSKYAGENAALGQGRDSGMGVSVLRPSIIYGEGRDTPKDSFLSWIRWIKSKRFFLLGDDYISSYIYVGDVVAAAIAIMDEPSTLGKVYIVNEPIALIEFANEMARICGRPQVPVLPGIIGHPVAEILRLSGRFGSLYNRTVYSEKRLDSFGFALPYGFRSGLKRTLEWYKSKLPKKQR